MRIAEFIDSEFFSLPKSRPANMDFRLYIFEQLNYFLQKLTDLKKTDLKFEDIPHTFDSIVETQLYLVKHIKWAVEDYYNGNPAKAYNHLKKGIVSNKKDFSELMYKYRYEPGRNFYRIRKINENFALPSTDFFHIPFEKRGQVETQRYSIPGFPSLYLGTTLYVCWEELDRPNTDEFQAVRLKNIDSIRALNLVPPFEIPSSDGRLYQYLMLWPLIFCSSVKVNNPKDTFKPEYIIPQLLLQWVRNEHDLDGIMYQTTQIDFRNFNFKGEFVNVVLPVKENKIEGHCEQLKGKFEMTESTSIQLNELGSPAVFYDGLITESSIDKKIQQLEIVKGRVFPYNQSKLGELEAVLLQMETKPI